MWLTSEKKGLFRLLAKFGIADAKSKLKLHGVIRAKFDPASKTLQMVDSDDMY